jgi:hypothetical protein
MKTKINLYVQTLTGGSSAKVTDTCLQRLLPDG